MSFPLSEQTKLETMEPLIWDLEAFGLGNEHSGEIRQMNHPEGVAVDQAVSLCMVLWTQILF